MATYKHDPSSVLDYGFFWDDWLGAGETLVTSTWIVPAGITKVTDTFLPSGKTTIWLSTATLGIDYTVTNHIKTSGGREEERSHIIACRAK